ncbi:RND transporter [Ahniella affigens]|uniref:RND transporter n=1 Tax=Ahniella affigens TaxID=2021234 RepID=A0A2P1PVG2_9GAMM|nr:HlyD family efflux transporter periplasmic adaptor subunit [Ahniella affigens]AVP98845.1 RND transporter [Ahniella affigens]
MDIHRPDLAVKKRRRNLIWIAVGVVALAISGYALSNLDPPAPSVARSTLWIEAVKRGDMMREVRGPGTLVPKEIRWIAAETAARVERILVKPGAKVEADTVILTLSNPEVRDLMLSAQAAKVAAEADYAARKMTLESQYLDQKATLATTEGDSEAADLQAEAEADLNKKGIISDINFRRTQLTARSLKVRLEIERERLTKFDQTMAAQLAADRARIEQLDNTYQLRRRQSDALNVRAGIAGVLQQVPVEEGAQLAPGTNVARVAKPDVLMAELRIAETQAKDVQIGQKVGIDTRNGIIEGLVARIDPAVVQGSVQVDVDLVGALPPGARPDLSVDGVIELERLNNVLYVSRPAQSQQETRTSLFRYDTRASRADRVQVELGRASVTQIEVRKGLTEGDQVVLSDTSQYDKYDRLKID